MGQRGSKAAFMPNKFVFPGGAVDEGDSNIHLVETLTKKCQARLKEENQGPSPKTLAVAAIRELWEETGLVLGVQSLGTMHHKTGQTLPMQVFGHLLKICIFSFAQSHRLGNLVVLMLGFFL
jgi:8-oxo-dGTP pyrophosphatase MutT (NUDIX family)